MSHIDTLRNKLHQSIEKGNTQEILTISKELDIEITKFMKESLSCEKMKTTIGIETFR